MKHQCFLEFLDAHNLLHWIISSVYSLLKCSYGVCCSGTYGIGIGLQIPGGGPLGVYGLDEVKEYPAIVLPLTLQVCSSSLF